MARKIARSTVLPIALLFLVAFVAAAQPPAPTYINQTKFARGQDVVPSFDGWLRNRDGTFTMVFGYLNRNYEEEPAIPAGPDNKVEPGAADQGQPTFFLPRRHAWVFRVKVPADWGNKELAWTITAHGRTEKAYGSLKSDEEILERLIMTRGNLSPGLDDPNQPPSVSIAPVAGASTQAPLTLTALVTDDGLPKPRVPKPRPAAEPGKAQTNSATGRPRLGLNVTWFEYRGPAKVTFDDAGPVLVSNGQAVTKAHFPAPGTYVLRATANDGELSVGTDITIQVTGDTR
ncbi:MAG TPA: hypothetical protein VN841_01790 [Bryobacteraceae bacterium]|nr:hypothetical protein [Bryobacteraceae bacterium]